MTRRSWKGLTLAIVYTAVNVGGAIYAAWMGEMEHAGVHVLLLLPVAWYFMRGRRRTPFAASSSRASGMPDRLTNLEQSIDAVAIEMERISEGQRAMTDLLVKQDPQAAPEEGTVTPAEVKRDRPS